jgi:hypothetical protein
MRLYFLLLFLVFIETVGNCQIWPKVLFNNQRTYPFSVIESYDKGYLIGGWYVTNQNTALNGLIGKLDVNGDLLWNKRLGKNNDGTGVFDVNQTSDGGVIIAGATEQTDSWGDPFIMKLNACGESEWCRIYTNVKDTFDYANSIYQVPGGYIAYVYRTGSLWANDHIHLLRLDQNGETIWQQMYSWSSRRTHDDNFRLSLPDQRVLLLSRFDGIDNKISETIDHKD